MVKELSAHIQVEPIADLARLVKILPPYPQIGHVYYYTQHPYNPADEHGDQFLVTILDDATEHPNLRIIYGDGALSCISMDGIRGNLISGEWLYFAPNCYESCKRVAADPNWLQTIHDEYTKCTNTV